MQTQLKGISSMATAQLLAELAGQYQQENDVGVAFESVGGVDAAKRVSSGEVFDLVVLASGAIDRLINDGHLATGSKVDLARSNVAVAVKAGSPAPAIGNVDELRRAIDSAPAIGYSTGPSGVALVAMIEQWGMRQALGDRLIQAAPGVPVGKLIADGKVALGFQQLSELIHIDGIDIIGGMPPDAAIETVFSGAVGADSAQAAAARACLAFFQSANVAAVVARHGMTGAGVQASG